MIERFRTKQKHALSPRSPTMAHGWGMSRKQQEDKKKWSVAYVVSPCPHRSPIPERSTAARLRRRARGGSLTPPPPLTAPNWCTAGPSPPPQRHACDGGDVRDGGWTGSAAAVRGRGRGAAKHGREQCERVQAGTPLGPQRTNVAHSFARHRSELSR